MTIRVGRHILRTTTEKKYMKTVTKRLYSGTTGQKYSIYQKKKTWSLTDKTTKL